MSPRPIDVVSLLRDRLRALDAAAARQAAATARLRALLPAELADHLNGVVDERGELTVFVDSPAWVTRFRFAVPALLPRLPGGARRCRFRVLPPRVAPYRAPRAAPVPGPEAVAAVRGAAEGCESPALAKSLERLAATLVWRGSGLEL